MDKISSYFNDCFSDNYFIFDLTHKTNANTDEEPKYLEMTTTILLDQVIREDASVAEEEEKKDGNSQTSSKKIQTSFVTQYITNFDFTVQPGRVVKGVHLYALVDINNQIYTERSFEDFVVLRKALSDLYPTSFLPVLPDKDYFKMQGPDCFEDRRFHAIKEFWDQIFVETHLTSTDAFQAFVDQSCNVEKTLKRYSKPSLDQMLNRYKISFQKLRGALLDESLYLKIERFDELAKEAQSKVKQLQEHIKAYQKFETVCDNNERAVYQSLKLLEQAMLQWNYTCSKDRMNSDLIRELCKQPKVHSQQTHSKRKCLAKCCWTSSTTKTWTWSTFAGQWRQSECTSIRC
eukprot:TRINITY_DN10051_c0_g1_i5.p1 TRINITY_DN10051_c0_g1~~TRINITY_DN10051_c0_g1_i5.p1  ORF type:complete len:347 (-),score=90.61 TRINITY_DN10051_c0_g1_i5:461-1501(-)